MPITVITADITHLAVDAIVNAANPDLRGGGGVDGAIHHAAGPQLLQACLQLPQDHAGVRCPTGEARLTPGFRLPARFVIHTVGPVWHDGHSGEAALLQACYRHSLSLLRREGMHSIAFPAISCGVYGYPAEQAARVAVDSLRDALAIHDDVAVTLCCFSERMRSVVCHALNAV